VPSDLQGPSPARSDRAWVVAQHAPNEGPGLLAGVLAAAQLDTHVVRLDLGDDLPPPAGLGGVVIMGGAMGVHDTDAFPWLETERRWIADTVRSDIPVLGVCLGAQLLAAALGAAVTTGPSPEVGVGDVALTAEGRSDPVLGPEGDRAAVIHWHGDTFEIPAGAVHLATGERYRNQAFRYGRFAYGLQFHVEVDDAMAEAWAPELPSGVTLDAGARRAVEAVGRRVLGRFVEVALAG
jgi:GMP synthase-like glutamine amidotransferase